MGSVAVVAITVVATAAGGLDADRLVLRVHQLCSGRAQWPDRSRGGRRTEGVGMRVCSKEQESGTGSALCMTVTVLYRTQCKMSEEFSSP